jgi:hypothetical protein
MQDMMTSAVFAELGRTAFLSQEEVLTSRLLLCSYHSGFEQADLRTKYSILLSLIRLFPTHISCNKIYFNEDG